MENGLGAAFTSVRAGTTPYESTVHLWGPSESALITPLPMDHLNTPFRVDCITAVVFRENYGYTCFVPIGICKRLDILLNGSLFCKTDGRERAG